MKFLLPALFYFVVIGYISAQDNIITGIVHNEENEPLTGALIRQNTSGHSTITNLEGRFSIKINPGENEHHLNITHLGYVSLDTLILHSHRLNVQIQLRSRNLQIDEVIVTARENSNGLGTRSLIEKAAIEHVQPSSLRDVLQLLPGQLAINPDLSSPQQILLRQTPTNSAGNAVAQLGTALIMDGSPVSNDANLQYNVNILNSDPGASPPFQSVVNRGFDLRQIPADQIESVEVIRGVPSARHGNFTAGAVLVNTRIGGFSPNIRLRANPNLFQVAAGAGIDLDESGQALSLDLDLTNSKPDPRDVLNEFTRISVSAGHQIRVLPDNQMLIKNKLYISSNVATRGRDAENEPSQRSWSSEDYRFRWNTDISYSPVDNPVFDHLKINASASYSIQNSFFEEFITTNVGPRPTFVTDTTGAVPYGTARYRNETTVAGRPFNYYHRLELSKFLRIFNTSHRVVAGTEFRLDRNKGPGRQFDLLTPPRQNYNAGDRPRSFDDVPTLNQLSFYLEDQFSLVIADREWAWQVGLRGDRYFLSGAENRLISQDLQPRINSSFEVLPHLKIRAAYGINSKTPGLGYLSPGPRFFDLINFNHYANNPNERLLIVTTRKLDPDAGNITSYTTEKFEAGLDGNLGNIDFLITYFKENTKNGPGFIRHPYIAGYPVYSIRESPENAPPILSDTPARYEKRFLGYDAPANNRDIHNTGIEYTINFPEWEVLKTSLNVNGAYIRSESYTNGQQAQPDFVYRDPDSEYIPYFQAGQGNVSSQFNTSLRFIHRIPKAGMVISSLAQITWLKTEQMTGFSPYPTALLDKNGIITPLSPEERKNFEYRQYWNQINRDMLLQEKMPPLLLFNLRLNKEFQPGRGFAFYVNNINNHRPLYQSVRSGNYTERNLELFFGAEIYYQF
ncbi:TonB-dependent receptor [Sinomicrobium soli]|uniref:TonB-dependent receptor n=1 Tax=Sinomicrobium sp. N-1-3-6 TaxID=2219864 RepID=UPI000DCE218C|nr:carboxypeptidase-like regulatory domain-containing protein [Sinomicrobium sp. N-1-3-6]RAV28973.1 outer membrane receptor protein [Sinomicrobium sp. N-1-3-6]